jgi:hypothetical protein
LLDPHALKGSLFDGYDPSVVHEVNAAATSMFHVIESIALDANVVWDTQRDLDPADSSLRMFQLTQHSAPSPYRRAFWLKKLAEFHSEKSRHLEAAINLLELCAHASVVASASGGKLSAPITGDELVFPFIDYKALSESFTCPMDGSVGRGAFLAVKDHAEFFSSEMVLRFVIPRSSRKSNYGNVYHFSSNGGCNAGI